jgi:hypothetical protein
MLTAICPFSSCFHKEGCLYFFATALIWASWDFVLQARLVH